MIVVIQCAASKQPDAGKMRDAAGRELFIVAHPELVPKFAAGMYVRPDDPASEKTWREVLVSYNADVGTNPWKLIPAWRLYQNSIYELLVQEFGIDKVFILSAAWGLVSASYLLPDYDVTFSASAEPYKRRRAKDDYQDFCHLPAGDEPIVFLGGKDYVPSFHRLTSSARGKRHVLYNSATPPHAPGCLLQRYLTTTRTNWHYECARALVSGNLDLN